MLAGLDPAGVAEGNALAGAADEDLADRLADHLVHDRGGVAPALPPANPGGISMLPLERLTEAGAPPGLITCLHTMKNPHCCQTLMSIGLSSRLITRSLYLFSIRTAWASSQPLKAAASSRFLSRRSNRCSHSCVCTASYQPSNAGPIGRLDHLTPAKWNARWIWYSVSSYLESVGSYTVAAEAPQPMLRWLWGADQRQPN